jgi:hypothetical protein
MNPPTASRYLHHYAVSAADTPTAMLKPRGRPDHRPLRKPATSAMPTIVVQPFSIVLVGNQIAEYERMADQVIS